MFRGDSGFCRQRILSTCARADVHYIVGLARNTRLEQMTEFVELAMKNAYQVSGIQQRELGEVVYTAQSWARESRVITRLECGPLGTNPRYVVTNPSGDPQSLYDDLYTNTSSSTSR